MPIPSKEMIEVGMKSGRAFPADSFSAQGQRLKHVFDRLDALHPEAAANVPHEDLH